MKYSQAKKNHLENLMLSKVIWTDKWKVREEFIWYLHYEDKSAYVIIPKGFITNFGSIPKILQNIFSPTKYLGYLLHDYLYSKQAIIHLEKETEWIITITEFTAKDGENTYWKPTRLFADRTLRESMKVESAWFIERNSIYYAVRGCGGWNFNT